MVDTQSVEQFKNGIFSLHTTRFGKVAEIMIKKIYGLQWANTNAYDLYDDKTKKRIEVKFSRATKSNLKTIQEKNVIDQCLSAGNLGNRTFDKVNATKTAFDSNIQQVKCRNFDILYYGLFYADSIEIFCIESTQVKDIPGYSDKQHDGNVGEGQFHLNNKTIASHRKLYFKKKLTYQKLYNILNT